MDKKDLEFLANKLNNLACKECTKDWLKDYEQKSNPIKDVLKCFEKGLISNRLKDRLINEIKEITS